MGATDPSRQPARSATRPLAQPFPQPGSLVRHAYRELRLAANGSKHQVAALGDPGRLPRPWEPASCLNTQLRRQVWDWLEQVVTWLNSEYVWHADDGILACWPEHPHLVHEIAVLTDQRHRAATALTSDALEDWHRYSLPAFQDRARARTHGHCQAGHDPWPARGRHTTHIADPARQARRAAYDTDLAAADHVRTAGPRPDSRLSVVDLETGEVHDP